MSTESTNNGNGQAATGKEIALPSGKKALIKAFKGKDIRQAQKVAGDDSSKVIFAIIAETTTIDEKAVVMEDLDEMEGLDVLALMGQFGQNFTPRQSK